MVTSRVKELQHGSPAGASFCDDYVGLRKTKTSQYLKGPKRERVVVRALDGVTTEAPSGHERAATLARLMEPIATLACLRNASNMRCWKPCLSFLSVSLVFFGLLLTSTAYVVSVRLDRSRRHRFYVYVLALFTSNYTSSFVRVSPISPWLLLSLQRRGARFRFSSAVPSGRCSSSWKVMLCPSFSLFVRPLASYGFLPRFFFLSSFVLLCPSMGRVRRVESETLEGEVRDALLRFRVKVSKVCALGLSRLPVRMCAYTLGPGGFCLSLLRTRSGLMAACAGVSTFLLLFLIFPSRNFPSKCFSCVVQPTHLFLRKVAQFMSVFLKKYDGAKKEQNGAPRS